MPVLVDYLNEAGIQDEDMQILVATGTHREATGEELQSRLAPKRRQNISGKANRRQLLKISFTWEQLPGYTGENQPVGR